MEVEMKNKFRIGSKVRIVNNGYGYTTYREWFKRNNHPILNSDYAFNIDAPEGLVGTVRAIHPHGYYMPAGDDTILYAVRVSDQIYLLSADGLEKEAQ